MADASTATAIRSGLSFALPALRWPWRYQSDGTTRDWRLDFLRGWCLFSMVCDHAGGEHMTFVFKVTGNGGYPMTGAHGFVFLSGTVMGLIYSQVVAREGMSGATGKALRRGLTLYLVATAVAFLGSFFALTPWGGRSSWADTFTLESIVGTLTLHGSDGLLTMYLIFVVAAPLCFYAFQKGKTWLVIAASAGIWLGHLYFPQFFSNPVDIFVPAAEWQVLFVTGLLVGYHRRTLVEWLRGWRQALYFGVLLVLFAGMVLLQVAESTGRLDTLIPGVDLGWIASQVFTDYDHNPPLHVLAIFTSFLAIFHVVDWLWVPLKAVLGWFLIPIGGATLYVYTMHIVIVYFVLLNIPPFASLDGFWLGVALLGLMFGFWLMVKTHFLYRVVPR
jgi:hypothetical protein